MKFHKDTDKRTNRLVVKSFPLLLTDKGKELRNELLLEIDRWMAGMKEEGFSTKQAWKVLFEAVRLWAIWGKV